MQRRLILSLFLIITTVTKLVAQKESDVLEYIALFKDIAMKEMKLVYTIVAYFVFNPKTPPVPFAK